MDKRQISMLYIGDGSVVEFLHKHNYQKMGFITHFASSFAMSIALLKKERVDVVVVNSNSLKLDTLELVKNLTERGDVLPPLVVTGIPSGPKTKTLYRESGAQTFIEQPIPLEEFCQIIFSLLGQKVRETKRTKVKGLGSVFCYEDKSMIECEILNLSEGGVRLRSPKELSLSRGIFKLRVKGKKNLIEVFGELKAFSGKKTKEDSWFSHRLVFLQILDEDRLYLKSLVGEDSFHSFSALYYD